MLFSIIIPVYNAEHYLPQCLDSIAQQTFRDFEVLLIDDASEDQSSEICKRYETKDGRFHLFRQKKNAGAAAARNRGLELAQGEYIAFIDSDDYWGRNDALQMLNELIISNNNPDILGSSMGEYFDHSKTISIKNTAIAATINSLEYYDAMDKLIELGYYYSSASGKVISRALIQENGLCFPEELRNNEDTAWSISILYVAKSIKWLDQTYYIYRRQTPDSASKVRISVAQLESMNTIIYNHLQKLKSRSLDDDRIRQSNCFIAYFYIIYLARLFCDKSAGYKQRREAQRKNTWLFDFHINKRVRIVFIFYRIFGYQLTGMLLAATLKHEERAILER